MNIFLWIIQALLAFFCLAGGGWKASNPEKVPGKDLPAGAWRVIGILELLCALALIIPAATKIVPVAIPVAALILALEGAFLAALAGRRNRRFNAANPLVTPGIIS